MVSKLNHEFGVLFGFVGAMIVSLGVFATAMYFKNKRDANRERERKIALHEKGFAARDNGVGVERVDGDGNGKEVVGGHYENSTVV
ncbi:uncharacterized protein BP5553_06608 [Venustampulla echinocandica]|uniref:Uncharacterized protein n=1 Tax=Venustampulla echinocandica TaxID=2656787 RepID=A0A370TKE7_9HELO|nr:uncharacterized protein BP5553_06608 [Venustampulla echinocandica]RDL35996.1 hypothetical protein BP5553_06608 [Venustampulla echinocandica]